MNPRESFTIVLAPEPAGIDAYGRDPCYRLKIGLKRLLRDCGLRAVSVAKIPATLGEDSTTIRPTAPPAPSTPCRASGGGYDQSPTAGSSGKKGKP